MALGCFVDGGSIHAEVERLFAGVQKVILSVFLAHYVSLGDQRLLADRLGKVGSKVRRRILLLNPTRLLALLESGRGHKLGVGQCTLWRSTG